MMSKWYNNTSLYCRKKLLFVRGWEYDSVLLMETGAEYKFEEVITLDKAGTYTFVGKGNCACARLNNKDKQRQVNSLFMFIVVLLLHLLFLYLYSHYYNL